MEGSLIRKFMARIISIGKLLMLPYIFRCRLQMEPPLPLYQPMETDMVVVKSMDVQHNLKVNKKNWYCCVSKK